MRLMLVAPGLPYLPCHDGSRLLTAALLEQLGGRHAIALVAPAARADTPSHRRWADTRAAIVETVPAGRPRHPAAGAPGLALEAVTAAIHGVLERFAPDVLHLDGAWLAPLAGVCGLPTVLSCHESPVLGARAARRLARQPWMWMRARLDERQAGAWERRWLGAADACVVTSEEDRAALAVHLPFDRIDVVPAGIDLARHEFRRAPEPERVVFTGHLAGARDAEAAIRLATAIMPRVRGRAPRAELLLAGADAAPVVRALGRLPGVRLSAPVADLRPSVRSGAVAAVPLDEGFGPRHGLLEAMALGTPLVASRRALSGLPEVLPGHHVLTAETDEEFAEAIVLLMREAVIAHTLARNARDLVERRYTWRAIALRYEALYARVAAGALAHAMAA